MYIYIYFDQNQKPLYVGSTIQPLIRFKQHRQSEKWMKNVCSVSVLGPYDSEAALLYEKYIISRMQPKYNINSINFDGIVSHPIEPKHYKHFPTIQEFETFFNSQPETYERCTFYLRRADKEALRILKFYSNKDISQLIRELFDIGAENLAKQYGCPEVYKLVSENLSA